MFFVKGTEFSMRQFEHELPLKLHPVKQQTLIVNFPPTCTGGIPHVLLGLTQVATQRLAMVPKAMFIHPTEFFVKLSKKQMHLGPDKQGRVIGRLYI